LGGHEEDEVGAVREAFERDVWDAVGRVVDLTEEGGTGGVFWGSGPGGRAGRGGRHLVVVGESIQYLGGSMNYDIRTVHV